MNAVYTSVWSTDARRAIENHVSELDGTNEGELQFYIGEIEHQVEAFGVHNPVTLADVETYFGITAQHTSKEETAHPNK